MAWVLEIDLSEALLELLQLVLANCSNNHIVSISCYRNEMLLAMQATNLR